MAKYNFSRKIIMNKHNSTAGFKMVYLAATIPARYG